MSLVFNDTAGKTGIIQLIERNCGFNDGDISGNATLLAYFTADVNLAVDELFGMMFPVGGTWQIDDANHTKNPILYTDLISGQRNYSFVKDSEQSYIIDIFKVAVADPSGKFSDIYPVDQQGHDDFSVNLDSFSGTEQGKPNRYDKTGNSLILDPIPNYSVERGLKMWVNREALRFLVSDTTKVLGFAHLFHEYLALRPSYQYAYRNLTAEKRNALDYELTKIKKAIKAWYGSRQKDVRNRMRPARQSNR